MDIVKEKKIIEFYEKNNIPYHYIWYFIKNNTKTPINEYNLAEKNEVIKKLKYQNNINYIYSLPSLYKENKITLKLTEKDKESLKLCVSGFVKHTSNIYVIDIDDEKIKSPIDLPIIFDILYNSIYIKGNTKGIHIYVKINGIDDYQYQQDVLKYVKGDLIRHNNIWERCDKSFIYGNDFNIIELEWNDIKHWFDLIKMNFKNNINDDNTIKTVDLYNLPSNIKVKEENDFDNLSEISDITFLECGITENKNNKIKNINKVEGGKINTNENKNNKIIQEFKLGLTDIEDILECLSASRCDNYIDWFQIGCIIRNMGADSSYFHKYSSKSGKYNYDTCQNQWDKCIKGGLNIGTLICYAKQDNLKMYNKIYNEKLEIFKNSKRIINEKKEKNKNSFNEWIDLLSCKKLADRFIKEWSDNIIISNEQLYIYRDDKWYNETENKNKLTLYISDNLYNLLAKEILENSFLEKKETEKIMKILRDTTCKKSSFNDIIKQILPLVEQKYNIFDNNPFLLGFNNGVYDLLAGEFREYNFNDYITISTGYEYKYIDTKDENNKLLLKDLNLFFESIQPNEEQREYLLKVLASGLDGIGYERLYLLEGRGGNGKGVCSDLMKIILGNYYCQPNNGIIKEMEKANSASPDMLDLMNKRYINFAEVKGLVSLSMLRKLTGGNSFKARGLYDGLVNFKMSATFCMEFNDPPDLDGKPKDADYRRMIHISFPVNFSNNENKIGKTIGNIQYKKADAKYKSTQWVESMRYTFLNILLEKYEKYKDIEYNTGLIISTPDFIQKESEKFVDNQNLFQIVFNRNFEIVDVNMNDDNDINNNTITTKVLWKDFEDSAEYRGLKSRRDKAEYGRSEYYEWLKCNFDVILKDKKNCIIGINKKYRDEDHDDLLKY
jgi:phage/plasmid-associated DNA primase